MLWRIEKWLFILAFPVVAFTVGGVTLLVLQRESERVPPQEKATRSWLISKGASIKRAGPERHIVAVDLSGTSVTDQELQRLESLSELKELSLAGTPITDGGLSLLRGLVLLTSLDLSSTSVTDAGLAQLAPLVNLEYLDVSHTEVTDEGIAALRNPRLRMIGLRGSGKEANSIGQPSG
jgi:Leucine-rich repeat (LRR) protein